MLLDVDLSVEKGSFVSVYGKSGAGKTTLLKMLAGLADPEDGCIKAGSEIWFDKSKKINVVPQQRNIGFVFQDYALFPNMSVRENLEFVSGKKEQHYVNEILEVTGLTELSSRLPATLSGGQQQRVALARALVRKPQLLLLDEPFSSLDQEMRTQLQQETGKIHRHFGLTTILISHDASEIYRLSDKVVELDFGKILKQGKPEDVFHHNEISGKIQLMGEVLEISQSDVVFLVKIISGNKISKVVVTKDQAADLKPGDKVLMITKAFNPVLVKISV